MSDQLVQAQVLYDSLLYRYRASATYDGTVTAGFETANLVDWRDFTLFRYSNAGVAKHITVTCAVSPSVVDSLSVWLVGPTVPASLTVVAEVSPDNVTWTSIGGGAVTEVMQWFDLSALPVVANYARVTITCPTQPVDFRAIALGAKLQFPIGQWADINPPLLYQGMLVENIISVNGSILGRNIKRIEKTGKIALTLLLPDWVRNYWNPFAIHASKQAFFYRWDPIGRPNELAFCVASDIVAPTNTAPAPRMKAEMPMRFLTP